MPFYFFPSIFFLPAQTHPRQGAAWHHLTSPCFLISILTVYQKRNRFGVRVLSTCMPVCEQQPFCPLSLTATGHFSELPGPAPCYWRLTAGGTGLWMCCTLCLGWGAVTRLRAVPAAALTPQRTCWRIPTPARSNNHDPTAVQRCFLGKWAFTVCFLYSMNLYFKIF